VGRAEGQLRLGERRGIDAAAIVSHDAHPAGVKVLGVNLCLRRLAVRDLFLPRQRRPGLAFLGAASSAAAAASRKGVLRSLAAVLGTGPSLMLVTQVLQRLIMMAVGA